jgi:hypothetical protein
LIGLSLEQEAFIDEPEKGSVIKSSIGGAMRLDMHFHVVGRGKDISQVNDNVFFYPEEKGETVGTFPPEWLAHGSDFPIPIDGWVHLPGLTHDMTWEEYEGIRKIKNLLDKDVIIKRAHGFSDSILENAEKILRLPR